MRPFARGVQFASEASKWRPNVQFSDQAVGIKEVDDGIWLVSFMDYDLGYIDLEEKTLQHLNNLLAQECKLCLRNVL
jgi:hypothetical protein